MGDQQADVMPACRGADGLPPQLPLHTIKEVGELLGCGKTKMYSLLTANLLRKIKIGSATRIPHDSLIEFIERATLQEEAADVR